MLMTDRGKVHLQAGNLEAVFLKSGDLYELQAGNIMINQVLSNAIDGALNNLYLRVFTQDGICVYPLIGTKSTSTFHYGASQVNWIGEAAGVEYTVAFYLTDKNIWFWNVTLEATDLEVDVIYGQDLGGAEKGGVRTNEAYMSQYMDHAVFQKEDGYVVCTRQNQPQQGSFPYIQQGALGNIIGYSTDGFQFFGLSYKETNVPEQLQCESLANEIYQYEFAYTALQTDRAVLKGKKEFTFYGLFQHDHPDSISEPVRRDDIVAAWKTIQVSSHLEKAQDPVRAHVGAPLQSLAMTEEEIVELFPNRQQVERENGKLLSFFTNTFEHVVLKEKELLLERPHGHILMSGNNDHLNTNVLSTTSYMYGVFNSQISLGNTSFHKMMSNQRNPLNILKTSGQRVYVEIEGTYRLLTMPSLFEMGFNYARWYYKFEHDTIILTNFTTVDSEQVQLDVSSENGVDYRYLVTNQITMGNHEYEEAYDMKQEGNRLTFQARGSESTKRNPKLAYHLHVSGADFEVSDERTLVQPIERGDASLVVLEIQPAKKFSIQIQGSREGEYVLSERESAVEIKRYRSYFEKVMNGFHLKHRESHPELDRMNALAWWYTHNMLVHYSVPRGLEQSIGAAWGTRDVCQGPTEYFMATQNYESVKEIIQTVYRHQYEDEGNWPQWFMFDEYGAVQQDDSHGDVVVWPLKVVADYLAVTGDDSILEIEIPYTRREDFALTKKKYPLKQHIEKQIDYVKRHFLHNTFLSSYGDGDWDDTLQPANAQLKKYMVSSWTVALTYQAIHRFADSLEESELREELQKLASGIEKDYQKFLLDKGILPGFLYMEDEEHPEKMLHPEDSKTGIHYRLLPMIRGMISQLLSAEEAEEHYRIIKAKLACPDGVRLMDKPANYKGGVSTHFKRAEQAANFGREIGLQYVHAHIRFIEAMAKLGHGEEVWNGLQVINPVGITHVVRNAEKRQSNAYFSSSDGKFSTRYEAQSRFDELKNGEVPVKGGWRIYSSGPGIYMNQLITNSLGIRQENGNMVIDPILPAKLDGLQFQYKFWGKKMTFHYHFTNDERKIHMNGKQVETSLTLNRYREGGLMVQKELAEKHLNSDRNVIDIWL